MQSVTMADEKKKDIVVSPLALATMMLHSARHGTTAAHGILVGTFSADSIQVTSAVPVCHEAPTRPLVETALAFVGDGVVGWYAAPERLHDKHPGAPALRIVASLGSSAENEPVLMVLQNESVAECFKGGKYADVIKAFGKDFGQQWMEPLEVRLVKETSALEAARQAHKDEIVLNDLVDHWEGESAAVEWHPSVAVAKCIEKHCQSI
jgi:hypothetical protein